MKFGKVFASLVISMTMSSSAFTADETPPEVTVDGLHRVHGTKMALVYADPGTDLSQYTRIYLTPPQIAFSKNWLRAQN